MPHKQTEELNKDYQIPPVSSRARDEALEESWGHLLEASPLLAGEEKTPESEVLHKTIQELSPTLPVVVQLTGLELQKSYKKLLKSDLKPTSKILFMYLMGTSSGTVAEVSLRALSMETGMQRRVLSLAVKDLLLHKYIRKRQISSGLAVDLVPGLRKILP